MAVSKCMHCGSLPKVKKIDGLYYVQCPGCSKHNLYAYVGRFEENAVRQWNIANAPYTVPQRIKLGTERLYPRKHPNKNRHRCIPCVIDGVYYQSLCAGAPAVGCSEKWLRTLMLRSKKDTFVYRGHTITKGKKDE